MANGKKPALSNKRNKACAGPPVLVLFDPSDQKKGRKIDYSDAESVKLWVLNRLHIYYCEDKTKWLHGFGDFEGILSSPEIYTNNKIKYRDYYTLKSEPPYIHFTTILPLETEMVKRFEDYAIKETVIETINKNILRPYPEGFNDAQKKFDFGFFINGIKVLKIPSTKIIYPSGRTKLSFWESYIYQYSNDGVFQTLKNKEANNEPWKPEERQELTEEIEKKLGTRIVTLIKASEGFKLKPENKHITRAGKCLFAFGMTEDVSKSKTDANKLPTQSKDAEQDNISGQMHLYQMSSSLIKPTTEYFKKFNAHYQKQMQDHFTKIDSNISDGILLTKIKEYLKDNLRHYLPDEINELSKHFHIAYEKSESKCILLAISSALELWRISLSCYHSDLAASKQFKSTYLMSVKEFRFATGCDAYSHGIVPTHIYIQVKNWWENLYQYQRDEIEKEVVQIEVIGYSSNTPHESDNVRLRADRAWKTAKSIEMVLKDAGIKRDIILVPILASSTILPNSPTKFENKLPILYLGEKIDIYPNRKIFKQEGSYVMDLLGADKVGEEASNKTYSDDQEDRISLVIFKRLIPADVNQIIKSVIISNTASPIYSYNTILTHSTSDGEIRMVVYVCPGQLNN